MLEFRVLGTPELVASRDAPLASARAQPKRVALLTYLALARSRGGHTRDHLLALLWPELDDSHARAALRQAVHHLRHALGEQAIVAGGLDELSLDPESITCDALCFEAELDADHPEAALALYRGDLLEGFFVTGAPGFEEWLDRERARLRARAASGAWALAERHACNARADEAASWGVRALALSRDDEAVLQRLLRLLDQQGDRVRAVLEYEAFARRMQRDYEMEPSSETRHIIDAIRSHISASRPFPEHVDAAVDRTLARVPADRFASAHDFADALTGRGGGSAIGGVRASATDRSAKVELDSGKHASSWTRWHRAAPWGALGLAIAGVAAAGWSVTRRTPPPAAPVHFELTLGDSVSLATDVFGPVLALSPNGREIAFVGLAGGRHRIYVRALDELTEQPLDGTDDGRRPVFSPDGQWIAFEQGTPATLQKVPLSGGQSTTVASGGVVTFDWDNDGSIVFARSHGLWRVSSAGGEPTLLAMPDTARGEGLSWPRTLPGVKTVLCNRIATAVGGSVVGNPEVVAVGSDRTIRKLGIAGTNPRYIATGHLLVTRSDGTVFAAPFDVEKARVTGPPVLVLEHVIRKTGGAAEFSVSRNGTLAYVAGPSPRQVTLMDRTGRSTVLLSGTDRSFAHPRFSPDGKRVALQTGDVELGDVWMVDIGTRTRSRVTQDGHSGGAEWTADGRQLLFWSGSPTRAALMRTMWDGSGVAETLAVGLHANEFAISPTSETIILRTSNAPGGLYVGSLDSIKTLHPWRATPAADVEDPRFSIDGKWIAYMSKETGRREVYVRSFTGSGGRLQVSTVGGHYPRWSGDGRTIFYSVNAYEAQAVGVAPHLIAATLRFSPEPAVIRRDTVFAGHNAGNIWNVYGLDYDVAPDGAHFAIISSAQTTSRAVVVVNWFTELRDLMAQAGQK